MNVDFGTNLKNNMISAKNVSARGRVYADWPGERAEDTD